MAVNQTPRWPGVRLIYSVVLLGMILLLVWQQKTITELRAANKELTIVSQEPLEQLQHQGAYTPQHFEAPNREENFPGASGRHEDFPQAIPHIETNSRTIVGNSAAKRNAARASRTLPEQPTTAEDRIHMDAVSNLPSWIEEDRELYHVGSLGGVTIQNGLTKEQHLKSPEWSLEKPLPLSAAEAEQLAREELAKFVDDGHTWVMHEIILYKETFEDGQSRWGFGLRFFSPDYERSQNTMGIAISFSGDVGITTRD